MYIWLSLEDTDTHITVRSNICGVLPLASPEANIEEIRKRRTSAMAIILKTHPELKGNESSRVYQELSNLAQCLPPGFKDLDFALHLGVAHACLLEAKRRARERVIDDIVGSYFGPPDATPAALRPQLNTLRTQMLLIPDAKLSWEVATWCGGLLMQTSTDYNDPACDQTVMSDIRKMGPWFERRLVPMAEGFVIFERLRKILCMLPRAERKAFVDFVRAPENGKLLPLTLRIFDKVASRVPTLRDAPVSKATFSILMELAACPTPLTDAAVDEAAEPAIALLQSQSGRQINQVAAESLAALQAGVSMGLRGDSTNIVLMKIRMAERNLNADLERKRLARQKAPPATALPQAGPSDMDPVHAWSVARLVRWIEGPVAERARQGRLNRSTVVAREKGSLAQDTQALQRAGLVVDTATPGICDADVDMVMNDGLGATARFFHDDIQDMAPMAKSLGAAAGLLERCMELQAQLQALSDKPATFDEEKARALLQDAEERIGELRTGIKVAAASAQVVKRFSTRLSVALQAEPLVLGKRHGGVIACPLQPTDWAWVAQMFHRRWLPHVTCVVVDGSVITLQADQALALYVTGSSQSSFAFDVSVHLWQRRAGRTSPASEGDELYPAMNTTDWFDTYIPCAVLHVPQLQ